MGISVPSLHVKDLRVQRGAVTYQVSYFVSGLSSNGPCDAGRVANLVFLGGAGPIQEGGA